MDNAKPKWRVWLKRVAVAFVCLILLLVALHVLDDPTPEASARQTPEEPAEVLPNTGSREWYATSDGRITFNVSGQKPVFLTDPKLDDYKPVPSPDGTQVAFFRAMDYGNGQDLTWQTKICVMNADGSNMRALTEAKQLNTNPMWTRDGSNKIIWTRIEDYTNILKGVVGSALPSDMNIYWTSPDAEPGEEEMISKGGPRPFSVGLMGKAYEFVYSGLRDGRLLIRIDALNQYCLMTPAPYNGGRAGYEFLSYPEDSTLLHKMTISPSETKIAYMKVANAGIATNGTGAAYSDAVIAFADFDADTLTISNEVEATEFNQNNVNWYASFTHDEDKLIYACSGDCPEGKTQGQIFEYDMETKAHRKVSGDDSLEYRYPAIKGVVK